MLKIPANIYWKDRFGIHLGCNDHAAEDTGLSSPYEYIGKSIYDISESKQAKIIAQTDDDVINSGQTNCLVETSGSLLTSSNHYFSIKTPLYDDKKNIVGLFGISFKLNHIKFSNIADSLIDFNIIKDLSAIEKTLMKYSTSNNFCKNYSLTKREAEVLFYLCQGKSAKEIGKILDISYRTVELHICHLKEKAHCKNKFELIEKFINRYPIRDK